MHFASNKGHTEIVKLLLEHNSDSNVINSNSNSALHFASALGHTEIVTLLLDNGSNPHICNQKYESPIYVASRYGNTEIVKLLLNHKFGHRYGQKQKGENIVNPKIFFKKSAIYTATANEERDIVELHLGHTN